MFTTAAWSNPRVKILGSKGFEANTNNTGNASPQYNALSKELSEYLLNIAEIKYI